MALSRKSLEKLDWVQEIVREYKEYIPLTVRQIYYQLVGRDLIENNINSYKRICELLSNARLEGLLNWNVIEDRTREFYNNSGFDNSKQFINQESRMFLNGYQRNLMQSQPDYYEIWIEKDALSSIFKKTADIYTIPVTVCKGYVSTTFINDYYNRAIESGKNPVILYFGDFDPSGCNMPISIQNRLFDMGLDVSVQRVALQHSDIFDYSLPNNPDALKLSDPRAEKFIEQYGYISAELDALKPYVLESKIESAIDRRIDLSAYQNELQIQENELNEISEKKAKVISLLKKGDK